jgi:hypothetical protein
MKKKLRFLSKDIVQNAAEHDQGIVELEGSNGPDPADMERFAEEPIVFDHATLLWRGATQGVGFSCNMLTSEFDKEVDFESLRQPEEWESE